MIDPSCNLESLLSCSLSDWEDKGGKEISNDGEGSGSTITSPVWEICGGHPQTWENLYSFQAHQDTRQMLDTRHSAGVTGY